MVFQVSPRPYALALHSVAFHWFPCCAAAAGPREIHANKMKFTFTCFSLFLAQVNTLFPGMPAQQQVQVGVLALTSYEGMGKAKYKCIKGCTCNDVIADSHKPRLKVSLLEVVKLQVTQHKACQVSVEVLPETNSGFHRYKVAQVIVTATRRMLGNNTVVTGGKAGPAAVGKAGGKAAGRAIR